MKRGGERAELVRHHLQRRPVLDGVARASRPSSRKGLRFSEGNTIGVGWDGKQCKELYFTKNGQVLSGKDHLNICWDSVFVSVLI